MGGTGGSYAGASTAGGTRLGSLPGRWAAPPRPPPAGTPPPPLLGLPPLSANRGPATAEPSPSPEAVPRPKRFPASTPASNLVAPSAGAADAWAWASSGARNGMTFAPASARAVSAAPSSWAASRAWPEIYDRRLVGGGQLE